MFFAARSSRPKVGFVPLIIRLLTPAPNKIGNPQLVTIPIARRFPLEDRFAFEAQQSRRLPVWMGLEKIPHVRMCLVRPGAPSIQPMHPRVRAMSTCTESSRQKTGAMVASSSLAELPLGRKMRVEQELKMAVDDLRRDKIPLMPLINHLVRRSINHLGPILFLNNLQHRSKTRNSLWIAGWNSRRMFRLVRRR